MPPGRLLTALLMIPALGCGGDPRFVLEKKPIAEVKHHGFRRDIPDERRGNATFERAVFTPEGKYLVTFVPGFRIWDPRTGELLRTIAGTLQGSDIIAVDGAHDRLLAFRGDIAPNLPEAHLLGIWDLRDGSLVGRIPGTDEDPVIPIGFTRLGEPIVLHTRRIEIWRADGSDLQRTIRPPAGGRFCERGTLTNATYTEKSCCEQSPSRRWLAMAVRDSLDNTAPLRPWLVDVETGRIDSIAVPNHIAGHGVYSFAFSSDERRLGIGTSDGMWIARLGASDGPTEGPLMISGGRPTEESGDMKITGGLPSAGPEGDDVSQGRFIAGEHKRGQFLSPMAFSENGDRIVALGDQLQVSTFDIATGALVGRTAPPFEDWEGSLRVSANGSRAVAYHFVSDILVVIDGGTGSQRGYICPYFCNRSHNPVEVPFAVSPDGRRVATGGRLGAGLWDTDADTLIAPLMDPARRPLKSR